MSNWITVNQNDLDIARHRQGTFQGVEIIEGLSPDDVPEKVRARFLHTGEFVVEFKYLTPTDETRLILKRYQPATPVVGSQTGRLYQVRISGPIPEGMRQQVDNSIRALLRDQRFQGQRRHYEVAAEAVSENAANLQLH